MQILCSEEACQKTPFSPVNAAGEVRELFTLSIWKLHSLENNMPPYYTLKLVFLS